MSTRIAVDLGGAELHLESLLDACRQVLEDREDFFLGLFGDAAHDVLRLLPQGFSDRVQWHPAQLTVPGSISAMEALRNYRQSSMGMALQAVRAGDYEAVVSCGNTGALVALSSVIVGRVKGIHRPAIFSPLPTRFEPIYMLDLGANHEASAPDLYAFAAMGNIAAKTLGIERPKVALLNIGSEDRKGHQIIQKAHFLLHQSEEMHYVGFVEPNRIFDRPCDVIVCDGFSGNLVLKSIEGTADYFIREVKDVARSNWLNMAMMYLLRSSFRQRFDRFHPDRHNGAVLLGLNNTVIKSHGSCSRSGFYHALVKAGTMVHSDLTLSIRQSFMAQHTKEEYAHV